MKQTSPITKTLSLFFSAVLVAGLWPAYAAFADSADDEGVLAATSLGEQMSAQSSAPAINRTNLKDEFNDGATQTDVQVSAGLYKLQAWGAKGGNTQAGALGGAGGTTVAVTPLQSSTLYVYTGGEGALGTGSASTAGGANGGGNGGAGYTSGYEAGGAGGGATHIATAAGTLASFSTEAGVAESVLVVAGGGGGGGASSYGGGAGGGATGAVGNCHYHWPNPGGGGQTKSGSGEIGTGAYGGTGGKGGTGTNCRQGHGGGGGGYFGGGGRGNQWRDNSNAGGGGGSAYLNANFIQGTKASDGGSVTYEENIVATTAQGGNNAAGKASMEYLASIVTLDNQEATTPGTAVVYSAPQADEYYGSYTIDGVTNQITSITCPTRENWVFKGYYTQKNGAGSQFITEEGAIVNGLYDQGTTTLYAWWWPIVTFDANGVEATNMPSSQTVQPNTPATRPSTNPSATSNTFKGWSTDKDVYREYTFSSTSPITQPTTLYAFWSPFVTFEMQGHGQAIAPQFLLMGDTATKPADPSQLGYTFEGWFIDPSPTATEQFIFTTPINRDTVLYAKWAANHYTMEFFDGSEKKGEQEFVYDEAAKPLTTAEELGLQREGWTFAGWRAYDELKVDFTDGQEVRNVSTSTGVIQLHAVWQRDISFVSGVSAQAMGGMSAQGEFAAVSDTTDNQLTQKVAKLPQISDRESYSSVTAPLLADAAGWNPVGWLSSETAASSADVDAGATFTPMTTQFYGLYNRDVRLIFDGNGATAGYVEPLADVQRMNSAGQLTPLTFVLPANNFSRDAYRFVKWDLGQPGQALTIKPTATDSADIPVYAQWVGPYEFAVVFDANGGEGIMDIQTIPEHVSTPLNTNAFTREGFKFTGWNTLPDGTGVAYAENALVTDLAEVGQQVLLYAQWQPLPDTAPDKVRPAASTPTTGDTLMQTILPILLVVFVVALVVILVALGMRRRKRH